MAQRAEEARKQLQVQLEEQVKEVERASEEERKSLQQELTRVKQEVVTIMKVMNWLKTTCVLNPEIIAVGLKQFLSKSKKGLQFNRTLM